MTERRKHDQVRDGFKLNETPPVPRPSAVVEPTREPTKPKRRSRDLPPLGVLSEHLCYECGEEYPVVTRRTHKARWGQDPEVEIEDELYLCPKCGEGYYTFEQAQAHERTLWLATITALRSALSQAQRDSERLLQFAGEAITAVRGSHIGSDWDGGSIEESMERCGLIAKVRATEPCGEDCSCAEWDEFPQDCFRATPLGQSAIDAARSSVPGHRHRGEP